MRQTALVLRALVDALIAFHPCGAVHPSYSGRVAFASGHLTKRITPPCLRAMPSTKRIPLESQRSSARNTRSRVARLKEESDESNAEGDGPTPTRVASGDELVRISRRLHERLRGDVDTTDLAFSVQALVPCTVCSVHGDPHPYPDNLLHRLLVSGFLSWRVVVPQKSVGSPNSDIRHDSTACACPDLFFERRFVLCSCCVARANSLCYRVSQRSQSLPKPLSCEHSGQFIFTMPLCLPPA